MNTDVFNDRLRAYEAILHLDISVCILLVIDKLGRSLYTLTQNSKLPKLLLIIRKKILFSVMSKLHE